MGSRLRYWRCKKGMSQEKLAMLSASGNPGSASSKTAGTALRA